MATGTSFGPYRIVAPIGSGGMGEVYRARDTRLDRDVAIKILPDAVASDPDRRGRFERETKAVAALSHPNILALFDSGRSCGPTVRRHGTAAPSLALVDAKAGTWTPLPVPLSGGNRYRVTDNARSLLMERSVLDADIWLMEVNERGETS